MSQFTSEELKNEVHAVLADADLSVVTTKSVREKIEKKFNCYLHARKKECDKYVMDFITAKNEEEGTEGKFTPQELRNEVHAILANADLTDVITKAVREQIENKWNCSLLSRKKECDKIVKDFIKAKKEEGSDIENEKDQSNEPEDDSGEDSPMKTKKTAGKKRPKPTVTGVRRTATKKRKTLKADDSGTESDNGADLDYEVPKKPKAPKKKAANGGDGGTGRKSSGFTRAFTLSPELSELMQAESLPRHEVVRKVWAIIKERNLYDPKNKQFAICDEELFKIMKVKRFRTFGMLKHLKPHFLE